jgi:hypothetical protein
MFDHPAWVRFQQITAASEHIWDQCPFASDPTKVAIKSSVWLAPPNIAPAICTVFGTPPSSLCNHPSGTHKALRGVDANNQYVTMSSGSENYAAGTNRAIAETIHMFVNSSAVTPSINEIAAVAGVIRGKTLPRHAVTHNFLHNTNNHCEARVLKHLHDAWCDAASWWSAVVCEKPCEACFKGDAKLLGPTGSLPKDEGLMFVDLHHVTAPELFTGNKTTFGTVHAKTSFCKTVRILHKNDAIEALDLVLAY